MKLLICYIQQNRSIENYLLRTVALGLQKEVTS